MMIEMPCEQVLEQSLTAQCIRIHAANEPTQSSLGRPITLSNFSSTTTLQRFVDAGVIWQYLKLGLFVAISARENKELLGNVVFKGQEWELLS